MLTTNKLRNNISCGQTRNVDNKQTNNKTNKQTNKQTPPSPSRYDFLPTTDPPVSLQSPATTLWNQRGNCFDFSVLLCALLEGAGYDAYVVHGYATRDVCLLDRSRQEVPAETAEPEIPQPVVTKVAPPNK